MAINYFTIPLANTPQIFTVVVGGISLNIRCQWSEILNVWMLDFFDYLDDNPLLLNLPLYLGVSLLSSYPSNGIPGEWFMVSLTDGTDATQSSLGVENFLVLGVSS